MFVVECFMMGRISPPHLRTCPVRSCLQVQRRDRPSAATELDRLLVPVQKGVGLQAGSGECRLLSWPFSPHWFSYMASSSCSPPPPSKVQGTLTRGAAVLDTCSGNWLDHLEWEKGLPEAAAAAAEGESAAAEEQLRQGPLKRLWDKRETHAPSSVAVGEDEALRSDCRHREDLVHLKVRGILAGLPEGRTHCSGGPTAKRVSSEPEGRIAREGRQQRGES